MIKLLKNELFKIFHKKGLYIILAITLTITCVINVLLNTDAVDRAYDQAGIDQARQTVADYEAGRTEYNEFYITTKLMVIRYDLENEKPEYYDTKRPERYYIEKTILPLYEQYYTTKFINVDEEYAEKVKEQIDTAIDNLHHFDWKKELENELKELEEAQELCKETECTTDYSEEIVVLKYRIKHEIPYTYNDASTMLDNYLMDYNTYQTMEKDESKITKHDELYTKRNTEESVAKGKYKLDHDLIKDDTKYVTVASVFISDMATISMMIVICIVLVSSAVVADEFNKGTIKQLLVRPYNRYKILMSKLIATFITTLIFIIVVAAGEAIVTGMVNGSWTSVLEPQLCYSFNTHSVIALDTLSKGFLLYACILPEVIIVILMTFFASTLFTNNGISTAIGIITYITSSLLYAYINIHKIVSYIPFVNWDFSIYLFGGISESKYMSLTKSLVISLITIAVLFIATFVIYKKKDIKNQ